MTPFDEYTQDFTPTVSEILWARLVHELTGAYCEAIDSGADTATGLALACEIVRTVDF